MAVSAVGGAGLCRRASKSWQGRPKLKSAPTGEVDIVSKGNEIDRPYTPGETYSVWTISANL